MIRTGWRADARRNLSAAVSGSAPVNVLSVEVTLPYAGYNQAPRVRAFYQTVHDRVAALPGVKAGVVTTD